MRTTWEIGLWPRKIKSIIIIIIIVPISIIQIKTSEDL